jgi:hypothetical protein
VAASDDSGRVPAWVWLLAAVVAVVAAVVVALRLRKSRR